MRTIPCFIQKNTPELVEKLKDLGLKVYLDCEPDYLLACHRVVTGIWSETALEDLKSNGVIDCGDNEDLFMLLLLSGMIQIRINGLLQKKKYTGQIKMHGCLSDHSSLVVYITIQMMMGKSIRPQ